MIAKISIELATMNVKHDNGEPCKTPHATEDQTKAAFVTEMNRVSANKDQVTG